MSLCFSAGPGALLAEPWRQRQLLATLVRREVAARYRGSLFGNLWALFTPLLMLAVYTFVFSVVFNARWGAGSTGGSRTEFALVLFAGLMVFNFFAECFTRAPRLVLENANYVKKVVFPLHLLPWVSLGAALVNLTVSLAVWLLFYVLVNGLPPPTLLLLPLVLLPLVLLVAGLSWALAALGVYLRDLAQLVGLLSTVLLFLSPIFYPIEALPEHYRTLLHLNPLTGIIGQVRDVLYWGQWPGLTALALNLAVGAMVAWGGFYLFQKTRKGFADVL